MTWVGLERYGYLEEAQRLAYRFLYMYVAPEVFLMIRSNFHCRMTVAFVDFNGTVPEKVGFVITNDTSFSVLTGSLCTVRRSQAFSHGRCRVWKPRP